MNTLTGAEIPVKKRECRVGFLTDNINMVIEWQFRVYIVTPKYFAALTDAT